MNFLKLYSFLLGPFFLSGCMGSMNPNGPPPTNYPYFKIKEPFIIKKILVPAGTKLIYQKHIFKKGKQNNIMNEKKLKTIELPSGKTIDWAGVPVTSISKFFNQEMRGFSVNADFNSLTSDKKTKFSELWQNCNNKLSITVKNIDDWSFNKENISDIEGCGVLYQRYFKEDLEQQSFLDSIYTELMNINSK